MRPSCASSSGESIVMSAGGGHLPLPVQQKSSLSWRHHMATFVANPNTDPLLATRRKRGPLLQFPVPAFRPPQLSAPRDHLAAYPALRAANRPGFVCLRL
ncbi:hypothetical protein AAFF_G00101850 [Aldrovandia affinis]|uniref:Uncharacterized protein n=1 Tax=Aldrovandia affinis TaxID=143900 RepID=A0AAD7RUG1_9TELE|nr:hypothetical protein AAFF_G00101850 [Aldrovandia affinis]